jgi:hypothetical protein
VIYQSGSTLGIGTTTPAAKLDVAGYVGHFLVDTSGAQFRFTRGSANYFQAATAGGYFDFVVNGLTPSDATASLKLAANGVVNFMAGNVGIGTLTPAKKLDVAGTGSFSGNTSTVNSSLLTVTQAGSTSTPPSASTPPAAVYGNATATTNYAAGVVGSAHSANGWGVFGIGGWLGVLGVTESTSDSSVGVEAVSAATTGSAKALEAVVSSPSGTAGQFGSSAAGAILINAEFGPSGSRSSVFQVDTSGNVWANGKVGVGTSSPATSLQVVGDIRVGTSGTNGCVQNFTGTAIAGTCSSDARLKTNIRPFSPVLTKLAQLQPVHFNWKAAAYPEYHFGSGTNSGLIAQEVEKVFPELVSVDAKGFKQVDYGELPYLMLQAIRELKGENDRLRAEKDEVQRQIATLEGRLAQIEARTAKPQPRSAKRTAPAKPAPGSVTLAKVQL